MHRIYRAIAGWRPLIPRSPIVLTAAVLLVTALPTQAARPSTIVTWKDWGPYVGKQLPDRGIASAIAREAFAPIDEDVTVQFRPWNRAYREARKGMHLGAFPYAYNEERAADFLFTDPLFTTSIRLFATRKHIEPDTRLKAIEDPSVCLPQGYNTRVAESLFKRTRLVIKRPRAMVNCMHMLRFGRVDLVLVSERVGEFIINHEPDLSYEDFFILSRTIETPVHIMVSRTLPDSQSLVSTLNEQIARMKANGRIQSVFDRFDTRSAQ